MLIRLPKQRILDFDIENRPLSYIGFDYTSAEITSIAWAWVDTPGRVRSFLLGVNEPEEILSEFLKVYEQADMVTGHYIRGHDLPVINGGLLEFGMGTLADKLVQDTKTDLVKRKYISASQENLADMFGIQEPKIRMTDPMWRKANRLTREGIRLTKRRVTYDVRQHIALRAKLLELDALATPRVWSGGVAGPSIYTP